jgi:hypothetical protein
MSRRMLLDALGQRWLIDPKLFCRSPDPEAVMSSPDPEAVMNSPDPEAVMNSQDVFERTACFSIVFIS